MEQKFVDEFSTHGREARVVFHQGGFRLVAAGEYVLCAVTHEPIPIPQLRYWNVDRQEAYVDSVAATQRHREIEGKA